MDQIRLELNASLVEPTIDITPAADEMRAAMGRASKLRRDLADESGVSAPLVSALLNGTGKGRRMSLHNIGLIAAALGYGVRVEVFPLGVEEADQEAQAA